MNKTCDLRQFIPGQVESIKTYFQSLALSDYEQARYEFLREHLSSIFSLDSHQREQFVNLLPDYSDLIQREPTEPVSLAEFGGAGCAQLSSKQLDTFHARGVLAPLPLQQPIDLAEINDYVLAREQQSADLSAVHLESELLLKLSVQPDIIASVKSLIGDDILLLDSTIHIVPSADVAQHKTFITHSDVNVIGDNLPRDFLCNDPGFVTVWLSISDADIDHAPLHFFSR